MVDVGSIALFSVVAFAYGAILIMTRNTIPAALRRPLALVAIFMVSCAFFLIVYSFFQAG
ncbi:hypothetical protein [Paenibacillus sp. y28]|uniref:hypothetical protein n=1 Tax=Paenibacillus sp. y28 TaxID=3129110 RepID=UPI00301B0311